MSFVIEAGPNGNGGAAMAGAGGVVIDQGQFYDNSHNAGSQSSAGFGGWGTFESQQQPETPPPGWSAPGYGAPPPSYRQPPPAAPPPPQARAYGNAGAASAEVPFAHPVAGYGAPPQPPAGGIPGAQLLPSGATVMGFVDRAASKIPWWAWVGIGIAGYHFLVVRPIWKHGRKD